MMRSLSLAAGRLAGVHRQGGPALGLAAARRMPAVQGLEITGAQAKALFACAVLAALVLLRLVFATLGFVAAVFTAVVLAASGQLLAGMLGNDDPGAIEDDY